jgi:hypothetical protein
MILRIAALGMILMEQSNPDLVIETAVSRERGNAVVTASLKNRGKLPLRVVLEDYFSRIETCLRDPQGKEIQARDDRAMQGAPLEPTKVTAVVIAPGAAAGIRSFSLLPGGVSAMAGPLSWELQEFAGTTLQVEFSYELDKERAERAAQLGAVGAQVGRWTSRPVNVAIRAAKKAATSWSVDGVEVLREKYEGFVAGLKPAGGWFCEETNEGGNTGEDLKDASGVLYEQLSITERKGTRHSIRRKN